MNIFSASFQLRSHTHGGPTHGPAQRRTDCCWLKAAYPGCGSVRLTCLSGGRQGGGWGEVAAKCQHAAMKKPRRRVPQGSCADRSAVICPVEKKKRSQGPPASEPRENKIIKGRKSHWRLQRTGSTAQRQQESTPRLCPVIRSYCCHIRLRSD